MNKNTNQRLKAYRQNCKKSGFPNYVFKKKVKPFPRPGASADARASRS